MSKFSFVINDDCTATVILDGKELTYVKRMMIYGEPLHYVMSIEQYARNKNNCFFIDENGEHLATKTRIVEISSQKEADDE